MKKIVLIILSMFFLLSTACSDFLKEASQDLIRPITVKDYKELLQGEGYFHDFLRTGWFVEVMTDNFEVLDGNGTLPNEMSKQFSQAFKWQSDLELQTDKTNFEDKFFMHMYENILAANSCLDAIDEMEGSEQEKNVLIGQASFIRAYAYFCLANLYAQAYNEAQPTDLCVPIIKEPVPSTQKYARSTIKEVWALICEDIDKAVAVLENDNIERSVFEVGYEAALLFATRVYLYMENYGKTIELGEKYLKRKSTLLDITTITGRPNINGPAYTPELSTFLDYSLNPEIVFSFAAVFPTGAPSYFEYKTFFVPSMNYYNRIDIMSGVSADLRALYTEDDCRIYWFSVPGPMSAWSNPMSVPLKYIYSFNTSARTQNMRTSEVYLNLAEAYACQSTPDYQRALGYVNFLRRHRIANYVDETCSDLKSLLDLIYNERRREFCFEEFHRWWDLRRWGQPSLEHNWLNRERYILEEKDPAYVLNFPRKELDYNTLLEINIRPERKGISIVE